MSSFVLMNKYEAGAYEESEQYFFVENDDGYAGNSKVWKIMFWDS